MPTISPVQLISVTPRAEKSILYIARVSSDQENEDTGLIKYLIRNGHWSPFEHASMTLEITTSRAIATQILRHRSFTFQEFSQRYASPTKTIKYEARRQADKNRQSSVDDLPEIVKQNFREAQEMIEKICFDVYERAIGMGIAKEQARFILPLSTQTEIYMTGTLRSWIHYLGDGPGGRTNEHTQQEHRDLALEAQDIFCDEFPIIAEALGWRTSEYEPEHEEEEIAQT